MYCIQCSTCTIHTFFSTIIIISCICFWISSTVHTLLYFFTLRMQALRAYTDSCIQCTLMLPFKLHAHEIYMYTIEHSQLITRVRVRAFCVQLLQLFCVQQLVYRYSFMHLTEPVVVEATTIDTAQVGECEALLCLVVAEFGMRFAHTQLRDLHTVHTLRFSTGKAICQDHFTREKYTYMYLIMGNSCGDWCTIPRLFFENTIKSVLDNIAWENGYRVCFKWANSNTLRYM